MDSKRNPETSLYVVLQGRIMKPMHLIEIAEVQ